MDRKKNARFWAVGYLVVLGLLAAFVLLLISAERSLRTGEAGMLPGCLATMVVVTLAIICWRSIGQKAKR